MLDLIRKLVWGRRVVPAAPPEFTPLVPPVDVEDPAGPSESEPDLESIGGIGCIITYVDSGGEQSFRRVTCRRLSRKGSVVYLQAYCHEREALRTFRLDRVTEVACGTTGEVFAPATRFFVAFGVIEDGGSAAGWDLGPKLATDLRASLNVLAFLARADGHFCPDEDRVIEDFSRVFAHAIAGKELDHAGVARYARQLSPDGGTFTAAVERIAGGKSHPALSRLVLEAASQLVMADGEVDPDEIELWEEVEGLLERGIGLENDR